MQHPAKKIKFLLRSSGSTIQQFADRMGIALENMRDILDEREWPTPGLIRRMCTFFGVGETYFGAPPLETEDEKADRAKPGKPVKLHPNHKLDMTEIAARQKCIIDLLISKNVFTQDEFDTRLEILRARVIARKSSAEKTR
jgi:transcriptional regulator with XRE-family HTH domain